MIQHIFNSPVMAARKLWMVAVLMFCAALSFSQTFSPMVFPAQGGYFTGGNLQMQFTIGEPINGTFSAGGYQFSFGEQQPEQNLTLDSVKSNPYYTGDTITAYFSVFGVYGPGNIFTLQLSDSSGSFSYAVNLGSDSGKTSGNISSVLPRTIVTGTQYRLRVISSYPLFYGGVSGPFTIQNIGLPVGINSQTVCSDSSYTFKFDSIFPGAGGNQVEIAGNKDFTGSVLLNPADSFSVTVTPNYTDTLWIRSRDSIDASHKHFGITSVITLFVGGLPTASVYPADTTLLTPGDTITLTANGGVYYYWPQFQSDSPSVTFAFTTDSSDYYVAVTGANGCAKDEHSHLRLGALNANVLPVCFIINPDFLSDTVESNSGSNISGCHDYLLLKTLVVFNATANYEIVQIIPPNLVPDLTHVFTQVYGAGWVAADTVGVDTAMISYSLKRGTLGDTLTWFIPASYYPVPDKYLSILLYTNCGTNFSSLQTIFTNLISSGSVTPESNVTVPIIHAVSITSNIIGSQYATLNSTIVQRIKLCSAGSTSIYGFTMSPPTGFTDTIVLNNSDSSHYLIFTSPFPDTVTEANIKYLTGGDSLSSINPAGCVYVNAPVKIPGTCDTIINRTYTFKSICNASAPAGIVSICSATPLNDKVFVGDNGNANPLKVTAQLFEDSSAVSAINICKEPFSIKYKLWNPVSANTQLPANSNRKHLTYFTLPIDTSWINLSALSVKYYPPVGSPITAPYTLDSVGVSVNLSGDSLNDSTGAYILLSGLQVNFGDTDIAGGPNSCVSPSALTILGNDTIFYLTNCGNPFNATSGIHYANNTGIAPSGGASLNGTNNDQVSPGDNPFLIFKWQQNPLNGNPWNFSAPAGSGDSSLFQCPTVVYKATLFLPPIIALAGDTVISYKDGNDSLYLLPMTPNISGGWDAVLPGHGFGNNVTMSVQVHLGDCPDNFPGGLFSPSLSLSAICEDGTCSKAYCFETINNTISVHCGGQCNGTGIGTLAMTLTNTDADSVQAAYACDVLHFSVSGQGYSGSPIGIDSTKNIFLLLTYPDLTGSSDPIFNRARASATYTYEHTTHSLSLSNISAPVHSSGLWTIKVTIPDTGACREIRRADDTFYVDLMLPVECNLPYSSRYQGIYSMNGINALFAINAIAGSYISYSCDGVTGNFQMLAHQYGTSAVFLPLDSGANPCSQTMVIKDSAIFGDPINPEMPGYNRPLITWPTIGKLTVSYPIDMHIQHLSYVDSSGFTYTDSIYDTTFLISNGTQYQTKIFGFRTTPTSASYWPSYSKSGPEFLRQLIVQFSQSGCGNEQVFDTIFHDIKDGKNSQQCATTCDSFLMKTMHPSSFTNSSVISLTRVTNGRYIDTISPLMFPVDTITYIVNNSSNLGTSSIFINPHAQSFANLSSNQLSGLLLNGTHLPMDSFTSLLSDTLQFVFSIDTLTCQSQTVYLPVGYSCSGGTPDTANFCGKDTLAKILITIAEPNINFAPSISSDYFPNVKGICRGDSLKWLININNSGGPAYSPVFYLKDDGPGYLDISKIVFTYTSDYSVSITTFTAQPNTYTNLFAGDFSQPPLSLLGFPKYNGRPYLRPGDNVQAAVYIFGDGENCSAYAAMEASLSCRDVCNLTVAPAPIAQDFYFNIGPTSPDSCTGNYISQSSHAWQPCNPCDYGPPLIIEGTVTNPSCHTNSGIINLTVGAGPALFDSVAGGGFYGFPDYKYKWNNGDTTSVIHNLAAGNYIVTVSDLGCEKIDTFKLNNSGLNISNQIQPVSCYGGNDGSILITATGDTAPYFYHWAGNIGTNANNTDSLVHLSAGYYTVTVTSSAHYSGCPDSSVQTFQVTQPSSPITIILSGTDIGCTNNPGSVAVSGITPPFSGMLSFHWNNGDTTSQILNLTAGVYTVTISENGQCTASAKDTIKHVSTAQLGNSPSVTAYNICAGQNEQAKIYASGFESTTDTVFYTLGYSTNGLPPFGHDTIRKALVSFGDTGIGTLNILGSILGQTYYQVTIDSIKTSGGCVAIAPSGMSATFTVTHTGNDTITLGYNHLLSPQTVCAGDSINLVAKQLLNDNSHYTWSVNPTHLPNYTVNPPRYLYDKAPANNGRYTYRVVFTSTTGCRDTASFVVNVVNHVAAVVRPATPLVCAAGDTILLTAAQAPAGVSYTYQWSPTPGRTGDSTATYTAHDTAYSIVLKVTDSYSCTARDTLRLAIDTFYVWINPDSAASCVGGRVYLTASTSTPVIAYHWSNNDSTGTAAFNVAANTVYAVTVTDTHGCSVADTTRVFVDIPLVTITTIPATTCDSGIAIANVIRGIGTDNYLWSTGVNLQADSGLGLGTYIVTITDQINCTASDTAYITTSFLQVHIAAHNSCGDSSGTATVIVTAGTSPISYLWSTGDTTAGINNLGPGTYSVTATHSAGCSATATVTILQADTLLNVNQVFYYPNNCHNLDSGAIIVMVHGGVSPYSYHWSNGDTTQSLFNINNGTYYETVTDSYGCQAALGGLFSYSPVAISPVSITPACKPGSFNNGIIVVVALGGGYHSPPNYTFTWSHGDSSLLILGTGRDSLYDLSAGTYILTVSQTGGGYAGLPAWTCTAVDTLIVDTTPSLNIIGADSVNGCQSQTISIAANTNLPNPVYHWSDSATTSSITIGTAGEYTLTVSNSVGCSVTASDTIAELKPYLCCLAHPDSTVILLLNHTVWSDTLHIPPGSEVYVAPDVIITVNSNLTLTNCELVLGAGAEVIVDSGGTLNLKGSTLHSCDTMWLGITVLDGGGIATDSSGGKRTRIMDAVYAVSVYGGATETQFKNTDFYRNQNGIGLLVFDASSVNIDSCYFGMGPYTNMLPAPLGYHNYKRPLHGIEIDYTGNVKIPNPAYGGHANTFQYMNSGISATGSYLYVYDNIFDSIRDYEGTGGAKGSAVVASGFTSLAMGTTQGLVVQTGTTLSDTSTAIKFRNCDVGVNVTNEEAHVTCNRMENVTYGIKAMNCVYRVWVDSNYINHTNLGVSLNNNLSAQQVVTRNTMHVNSADFTVSVPSNYPGVFLSMPGTTTGISEDELNNNVAVNSTIFSNYIYNGRHGIFLNNVDSAVVYNNYLYQVDRTAIIGTKAGFRADNCAHISIESNTITGDTTYYGPLAGAQSTWNVSPFTKVGINFYHSTGEICNNVLGGTTAKTGIGYGINLASECYGTKVHDNTMNQSTYGLVLQSSGSTMILGDQGYDSVSLNKGQSNQNDFAGDGSGSHEFAGGYRTYSFINISDTSLYHRPTFYYTGADIDTNIEITDSSQGTLNGHIQPLVSIKAAPIISSSIITYICEAFQLPVLDQWKILIAHDSAGYYMEPGFGDIGQWLSQEVTYNLLVADTTMISSDTTIRHFYDSIAGTPIGQMNHFAQGIRALTDSAVISDSVRHKAVLDTIAGIIKWMSFNNTPEQNFITLNNISVKLLTHPQDTFTTSQITTLATLAVQCPYVAGDAVYAARALLAQVDHRWHFDDVAICDPSSSERILMVSNNKKDSVAVVLASTEYVSLFPNPTGNQLNLLFKANVQGSVEFEMLNTLGQTVKMVSLPQGINSANFDVSNLANGIYYWRLNNNTRIIASGKEVIAK